MRRNPDITRAQSLLGGWAPQVSLERGLEATIAYFLDQAREKLLVVDDTQIVGGERAIVAGLRYQLEATGVTQLPPKIQQCGCGIGSAGFALSLATSSDLASVVFPTWRGPDRKAILPKARASWRMGFAR